MAHGWQKAFEICQFGVMSVYESMSLYQLFTGGM